MKKNDFTPLIDFSKPIDFPNADAIHPADEVPPWRRYADKAGIALSERSPRPMQKAQELRGRAYIGNEHEALVVTAALMLRRPLLVTGRAGVGKSMLAYAVAWRLGLGNVLRWGVTSRSTLKDGLYHYDAIGRLNDSTPDRPPETLGKYITLGPLGTALLPTRTKGYFPRVVLIDEVDKGDADFPSDLLHVFEEGCFPIPEIARLKGSFSNEHLQVGTSDPGLPNAEVPITGLIECDDFPFVIMTSNGEREFPPAFLRRCIRLDIQRESEDLIGILASHLGDAMVKDKWIDDLIDEFTKRGQMNELATDQLLNAAFLLQEMDEESRQKMKDILLRPLSESPKGFDHA